MGKASKATKKFAASGQLKKAIQARHKHQQIRKKIEGRKGQKNGKPKENRGDASDDEGENNESTKPVKRTGGMTVDDFLNGDFMDGSDVDEGSEQDMDENLDEGSDIDDNASFASVDELDDEGGAHMLELNKLAEKDPEFYKYLQENDRELLNFDPAALAKLSDDEGEDNDEEMDVEDEKVPILTKDHLRKWQKAILEQHSLRALRKLLIAFRSAAHMNEDNQVLAWSIDSSAVYNKLVTTTLRYTPMVLEHHIPYKTLANGKFKSPAQTPKFKTLQKLILSYFNNVVHIISQLTDQEMLRLALAESSKIIPYILSSRKSVKSYLKKCLDLWSSADDTVRVAAFLSIRRLTAAPDESIVDNILKSTYLTLIRSSKSTNAHILPSINLMKNSASEIFCVDHAVAYQHAFGYIRQLAIHLRNSMKVKTKEAYKQVYNWQFIHCIDFWCTVLARACDVRSETESRKESELRPLIYPLVQVSIGAIRLVPNSRSYPFHFHIVRSLLHLSKHTETYIPLSPHLVPILSSALAPSSRPKSSTLKQLDLEVQIRIPQQYIKTRVCSEGITEEALFLLADWLSSSPVHGSIAFPEIIVPVIVQLRKSIKNSKTGASKEQSLVKTFLERVEESGKWIEQRRKGVHFAPGKIDEVQRWEEFLKLKLDDAPLSKYVKVQRKIREKRRNLMEKARTGEDEILDEE